MPITKNAVLAILKHVGPVSLDLAVLTGPFSREPTNPSDRKGAEAGHRNDVKHYGDRPYGLECC